MKTIVKIGLGIVLGGVLLIGGCVALIGGAANEASDEIETAAREANGGASSSSGKPKTLDVQRASGTAAIAQASGTSKNPDKMTLRVSAAPSQQVSVTYNVVCNRGTSASTDDDQFKARAPFTRKLKPSMPNSDECIVSANAQLEGGSGRVKVTIIG